MRNVCISLIIFTSSNSYCQTEQFIIPIDGAYLNDYFLVNYVDWSFAGYTDYLCGSKSYDGHQGTDFVIRNFSQMDSGVAVFAAKDGIVTYVIDTLFDRNKTAISGGLGNYICIKHDNLFYTYYGHLKKNSALVSAGDSVLAGEIIGLVGSSGYTSDPHLHFEVWYDSLINWDPFSGTCGNPQTLWIDSLTYNESFGVIDHDCNNFIPTLDTLKERLPSQEIFSYPADTVINFWMQGYGVLDNDISKVKWIAPDGSTFHIYSYTHTEDWWYYYFWSYIPITESSPTGTWKIQYLVNDEVKIEESVEVIPALGLQESFLPGYAINYLSDGNIMIQWKDVLTELTPILIYDLSGKIVFKEGAPPLSTHFIIPRTIHSNALYFLKIGSNNVSKIFLHSSY